MSVDDQIKHLEEERDHLLSTTPLERIPNKNKGFHTNHSNIKAKYNSKITNLKKYGVDNPFKLKEVQDQIKQTNLNKYGVNNIAKLRQTTIKKKETCLERYGVDHFSKTSNYKDSYKDTCLKRYGTDNPLKNKEIQNKVKETQVKLYGSYAFNTNKQKETNLKKYGVDNPFKLKEVQDQIKQTNLNRYGFENASKSKIVRDKLVKSSALANIKRYETKKKNNSFHISKSEERIGNLLDNLFIHLGGIKRQYKSDLYPFACDFYIPCLDLYIECHFTWLHGGHPFDSSNQDDLYLVEKWKSKNTKYYNNAIYTWTDLDVRKLNALKNNKLNYIIFYKENDFYKWLEEEIL